MVPPSRSTWENSAIDITAARKSKGMMCNSPVSFKGTPWWPKVFNQASSLRGPMTAIGPWTADHDYNTHTSRGCSRSRLHQHTSMLQKTISSAWTHRHLKQSISDHSQESPEIWSISSQKEEGGRIIRLSFKISTSPPAAPCQLNAILPQLCMVLCSQQITEYTGGRNFTKLGAPYILESWRCYHPRWVTLEIQLHWSCTLSCE